MQTNKLSPTRLWRLRLQAFLIDYLVICAYLLLLALVTIWMVNGPLQQTWPSLVATPAQRDRLAFTTAVLPVILYFTLMEGSAGGATLGKRRFGLRVVDTSGGQLPYASALVRAAVKLLPWQIAHTCLFNIPGWPIDPQPLPGWVIAGFILVWVIVLAYLAGVVFFPGGRTLYDRAARARVVAER